MKSVTRYLFAGLLLALSAAPSAAERMNPVNINSVDLTAETQQLSNANRRLDMAWWIPVEFWEAVLMQDPMVPADQAEAMLEVMRPYFLIVVVQADISPFGSFEFLEENRIRRGMRVAYTNARGVRSNVDVLSATSNDFELLLLQVGPILAAAMGNLGENFHFYSFSSYDEDGNRIGSPFDHGSIDVSLDARENEAATEFRFEAPLNSLFVPRICANGKPAHISWSYCPWDGSKLTP